METSTQEEMQRVPNNKKLVIPKLNTSVPAKKKPMITVYDIPKVFDEQLLLLSLEQQNFEGIQKEKYVFLIKMRKPNEKT